MSRVAVLARARAAAEAGMADACSIRRITGSTTQRGTGVVTPTYLGLYAGKCRLQQPNALSRPKRAGEDYLLMLRIELQLPMSVTGLAVGDEVTITASQDPDLVGRVLLVHDLAHKTDASARRVGCEERTGS